MTLQKTSAKGGSQPKADTAPLLTASGGGGKKIAVKAKSAAKHSVKIVKEAKVVKEVKEVKEANEVKAVKEVKPKAKKYDFLYAVGKRKSSSARVRRYQKSTEGKILVNGKDYTEYFPYFEYLCFKNTEVKTINPSS